jgi:Uncharacterised protein family (UPF0139)
VIYMGLSTLRETSRSLIGAGMDRATPAAAVERGTTPAQRVVYATVEELADKVEEAQLVSPTLIIIGGVVALSPGWREEFGGSGDGEKAKKKEEENEKEEEKSRGAIVVAPAAASDLAAAAWEVETFSSSAVARVVISFLIWAREARRGEVSLALFVMRKKGKKQTKSRYASHFWSQFSCCFFVSLSLPLAFQRFWALFLVSIAQTLFLFCTLSQERFKRRDKGSFKETHQLEETFTPSQEKMATSTSTSSSDPRRPEEARSFPPQPRQAEPDAALLLSMVVAVAAIFFKARAPFLPWLAAVFCASGCARYSRRSTAVSMLVYSLLFTAFAFANVYLPAFARTSLFEPAKAGGASL